MLHLDTFLTMREHYPTLYLPDPLIKFHEWTDNSEEFLMDVFANMAARDIVREEEDAVTRNNKSDDKTVPKALYDQVVKNLPPRRAMCERLGCAVFKVQSFNLPVTPFAITIKDPPAQAAQKRKQEQVKKAQGRQHGPMSKKEAPPTSRTSRQASQQQAKEKREKEERERAAEQEKADKLEQKKKNEQKKNAAKNTASNAAAGSVAGGQPMPADSHPLPAHLRDLPSAMHVDNAGSASATFYSPSGSPAGSAFSGSSSQQSAAITEMHASMNEMKAEMSAHREEFKTMLKTQHEEYQKQLLDLSSQLAASQATVAELRLANASKESTSKTLENMCNNMMKTMETMQVARCN